ALQRVADDAGRAGLSVPLADLERAGDRRRAVALADVLAVLDLMVLRVAAAQALVLSRSGAAVCGYDCAMAMDSSALRELARDLGVGTDYWGWDGNRRDVDDDTLRAVLRSEERRVGKERRAEWCRERENNKEGKHEQTGA